MRNTIVTACDRNYIWGAYLLVASLRRFNIQCKIKIVGHDFDESDEEIFWQFEDVVVVKPQSGRARNVCTQKPEALYAADTDYITWMDSDCMVDGDISRFLIPEREEMLIRFRGVEENRSVFRGEYRRDDDRDSIPESIKKIWQKDVDDLGDCRINTVSLTNCFVIHRSHIPFIRLWEKQMDKVLGADLQQVYNKKSRAYFMTDESVFNSLLAFSSQAPDIGGFPFDKEVGSRVIHFGMNPKPWKGWTMRHLEYYDLVLNTIQWCIDNNLKHPVITTALSRRNYHKELWKAKLLDHYRQLRHVLSSKLKYNGE